jgi:hypothetical protein
MMARAASVELAGVERLADHAGRGEKDFTDRRAGRLGGDLGCELRLLQPGLAGEGVGIAGIDHQRPRFAALELGAAPVHRRRRAFRFGEDAGYLRPFVHQRQHHVGAALIADAGSGGGETHPVDGGQIGIGFRRERGHGDGLGQFNCSEADFSAVTARQEMQATQKPILRRSARRIFSSSSHPVIFSALPGSSARSWRRCAVS